MKRYAASFITFSALLLVGCHGSGDTLMSADDQAGTSAQRTAVAPQPATGKECRGIYGDAPAKPTQSATGTVGAPFNVTCQAFNGEVMNWTDPDGTARQACLRVPDGASKDSPRPLITFLQGSIFPADPQAILSQWNTLYQSADLSGDPARPGFILLIPYGRDTTHFYPFPDDTGLGWDNWYRNFNRDDPAMNRDGLAIDHFIQAVKERGIVDDKRVYMSGWSNGAAMAILYGLNTPGIAATAVYSAPDAFKDVDDPCAQPPFGDNLRPIMTVHNSCDIIGICSTGSEQFKKRMAEYLPQVDYEPHIIDISQKEVQACDHSCDYDSSNPLTLASPGAARHLIWPSNWNSKFFAFLREHPLP